MLLKDGYTFRNILPRALQIMADAGKQDRLRDSIAEVMHAATAAGFNMSREGGDEGQQNHDVQQKIESLLEQILEGDQRSAQQNVARLNSCNLYFQGAGVPNTIGTTSAFMQSVEYGVNRLLRRSALLFKITNESAPSARKEHEEEFLVFVLPVNFFVCALQWTVLSRLEASVLKGQGVQGFLRHLKAHQLFVVTSSC